MTKSDMIRELCDRMNISPCGTLQTNWTDSAEF